MPAAAETIGQTVDDDFSLGTKTDFDFAAFRFQKHQAQLDAVDAARKVGEAFGVARLRAGASHHLLRDREPDEPAVFGKIQIAENLPEQAHFVGGLFLINLLINVLRLDAARDEIRANFMGARIGVGKTKSAGVGENRGIQGFDHLAVQAGAQIRQEIIHDFPG